MFRGEWRVNYSTENHEQEKREQTFCWILELEAKLEENSFFCQICPNSKMFPQYQDYTSFPQKRSLYPVNMRLSCKRSIAEPSKYGLRLSKNCPTIGILSDKCGLALSFVKTDFRKRHKFLRLTWILHRPGPKMGYGGHHVSQCKKRWGSSY